MRCLKWEAEAKASGYPEGGCIAITNVFLDGIRKYGGELVNNADVKKIIIEDNKAVGVQIGDETIYSDMIVSNVDLAVTTYDLVGKEYYSDEFCKYVDGLKYSWSCAVLKMGLDKKITDIKFLAQFGMNDQEEYEKLLLQGTVPPELNMFVVVPSNFSSAVAPEGKQVINATSAFPVDAPMSLMDNFQEAMMKTLEKYVPDIREHIIWLDYMDRRVVDATLGEQGAGIGIGQRPGQSGKMRPKIKQPIEQLYCVGAHAGGEGVGIELCINSAIEFFENYCN